MPLCKVQGILLKAFNWSESSRTIVFFTREMGRLALIDKGGRSIKTKRGRLLPFSRLEISYYGSEKSSDGYISDLELLRCHLLDREGSLGRLAYASAACELCFALLPEHQVQEELYDYLLHFMEAVDTAERAALPGLFVAWLLRSMSLLGYHPSLAYCAGCDRTLGEIERYREQYAFGSDRGGIVCPSCQRVGEYYIPVSADDILQLAQLQRCSLSEATTTQVGFETAGRMLHPLTSFLQYHAGFGAKVNSLDFLDKLAAATFR